ncbi:unnamed protein product [Thelazia callipaeda]|uniref:Flocculation protein FLO11-like n=1 Tax=Thelazia callipaeda TaxID=103827 RepID=A0A0N5CX11_THECL|nr:unnamed protein product [Thelazia callipaeda]
MAITPKIHTSKQSSSVSSKLSFQTSPSQVSSESFTSKSLASEAVTVTPSVLYTTSSTIDKISQVTAKENSTLSTTSTVTSTPKQTRKPGPKLPNCDYCLPSDVLLILAENKDFYKNECNRASILRNAVQKTTNQRIDLKEPCAHDEEKIVFDVGEGTLQQTPKRA